MEELKEIYLKAYYGPNVVSKDIVVEKKVSTKKAGNKK